MEQNLIKLNQIHQDLFINQSILKEHEELREAVDDYNHIKKYINKSRFLFKDEYEKYIANNKKCNMDYLNILRHIYTIPEYNPNPTPTSMTGGMLSKKSHLIKSKPNPINKPKPCLKKQTIILYNDIDDEKLLLTFINKNPEVLGLSLLDLNIPAKNSFDPSITTSQGVSTNEFNVGFTTEYVQTQAADSNTGGAIQVNLGNNLNAMGLPKENGKVSFKWRTRAAETQVSGNTNAVINLPNNPTLFYIPLTANSGFTHLSGFLTWNCNDLLKDIDTVLNKYSLIS